MARWVEQAEIERRVARLYAEYARAVDDGDLAALRAMVIDDVVITRGGETFPGAEEFMAVYRGVVDAGRAVPALRDGACWSMPPRVGGSGCGPTSAPSSSTWARPASSSGGTTTSSWRPTAGCDSPTSGNLVERVVALPASTI